MSRVDQRRAAQPHSSTLDTRPHTLYRFYNKRKQLLYVGITHEPKKRFLSHSSKPWWQEVSDRELQVLPTRADALFQEALAIVNESPIYNVSRPSQDRISILGSRATLKPSVLYNSKDPEVLWGLIDSYRLKLDDAQKMVWGLRKSLELAEARLHSTVPSCPDCIRSSGAALPVTLERWLANPQPKSSKRPRRNPGNPVILNSFQAAALLGVNIMNLAEWRKAGVSPVSIPGKKADSNCYDEQAIYDFAKRYEKAHPVIDTKPRPDGPLSLVVWASKPRPNIKSVKDAHGFEVVREVMVVSEVATLLGVGTVDLAIWRTKGFGPTSTKIGGRHQYRLSDLEKFVDSYFPPKKLHSAPYETSRAA